MFPRCHGRWLPLVGLVGVLWACGSDEAPPSDAVGEEGSPSTESDDAGSTMGPEARVGLSEADGRRLGLDAVVAGSGWSLVGPITQAFKALPLDERGEVIWGLALCLKAYVQSDAFRADYLQMRAQNKPAPPVYEQTVEEEFAAQEAEQRKNFEDTRRDVLPALPPESRAGYEEGLASMEAMMEDPQMREVRRQSIAQERESDQASYQESLVYWTEQYPENPQPLVARRLQEFLAATADVDFDAEVIEQPNGHRTFADPEYEQKAADWKWTYRAGRDSAEAARKVASMWLSEL